MPPRANRLWMAYWLRCVICGSSIDGTNVSISLDLPIHTRYTLLLRFRCQVDARENNLAQKTEQAIHGNVTAAFSMLGLTLSCCERRDTDIPSPFQGVVSNVFVSINNKHAKMSPHFFFYDTIFWSGLDVYERILCHARPPCLLHRRRKSRYLSALWAII